MLNFETRLAMLNEILSETTPEKLFEELSQYEAVGPKAESYTCLKTPTEYLLKSELLNVTVTPQLLKIGGVSSQLTRDYSSHETQELQLAA